MIRMHKLIVIGLYAWLLIGSLFAVAARVLS